jgi:rubrerythrin
MIKLQRAFVTGIQRAETREELYSYLQNAIELEHATIPPYLTAMFSLKPSNANISRLIGSIVRQEMMHMTIAANVLNAIGGQPQTNKPEFIPTYPGPLPMSIGGAGFDVGIAAFSKSLLENVFMKIEEPEHPIPVKRALAAAPDQYATIGEFYEAIIAKIRALGNRIFVPAVERQVLSWFPPDQLYPITNVDSACSALDIIVRQGEGTTRDPMQSPGDPAHYYKFGEIVAGRRIVKQGTGWAYAGEPIPYDEGGVYPMKPNPTLAGFPRGSQARTRAEQFAYNYTSLLNALQRAFNGEPKHIDVVIGLMYDLKVMAVALMSTPLWDGDGMNAGPCYEYVTALTGAES